MKTIWKRHHIVLSKRGTTDETVSTVSHIPKDKGSFRLNPFRVYINFNLI